MSYRIFTLLALTSALLAAGCSTLEPDRIDYKSATKSATLEVPPDLTAISRDTRYNVPGTAVTASAFSTGQTQAGVPVAANALSDVRIERSGNQRWLVVARPADQLWGPVRDFWQDNGFLLNIDRQDIGVMETDWAENRAKLPQDFIRNTVGKILDSLYDTGERDRFRTRLERNGNNTEIYISHRGMVEKLVGGTGTANADRTLWEPRAADPELETEMLRRLMLKLGVSQEQAKTQAAAGVSAKLTSRVANANGIPVVQVEDGFDRAWRRVGLSLDRTGFTVEDRDRAQGVYFVRYVEPKADTKEPGFFSKLFGASSTDTSPLKYRIALKSQGESTTVSVLNANGSPESSENAQRIVKVLADDLR
ncbi:outer membrane protein assembly factor BamC [Variovorax sp. PCZ-1]|uniref:outer membrane protein assembly factor BamC n=1 Tax=Variovorax sp. PCZ-1 TaxID=2835533 RepID=UPI001BCD5707|nr:outer membrane protein assembly factor BamC [Variovorax sp. PCZ-1]MBS7806865.1 outer membrane protein assembly factor BamC [Variovorax sp. PCZ-1]